MMNETCTFLIFFMAGIVVCLFCCHKVKFTTAVHHLLVLILCVAITVQQIYIDVKKITHNSRIFVHVDSISESFTT